MRFCEQNFFGNFSLFIFNVFCKFGRIMSCRSSEFTENVFFSLRNSYKFLMFTSCTTASSKTESMRARLLVYRCQYKKTCTKLMLFSGVFKPASKVKERRLHFAMHGEKHSLSTWKILESSSSKFKYNLRIKSKKY